MTLFDTSAPLVGARQDENPVGDRGRSSAGSLVTHTSGLTGRLGPAESGTVAGAATDHAVTVPRVTPAIAIVVYGNPAPQGSKRHVGNGVMIESSKKVKPWRQDVVTSAKDAIDDWRAGWFNDHWQPLDGPLAVRMMFSFTRPKSHYRTGRNAHLLRDDAPCQPCSIPDLSKLCRSTEDALTTAGVWRDDARVAEYDRLAKVWCNEDRDSLATPGVRIEIRQVSA